MLHAMNGDGTSVDVQQSLDAEDGLAVRVGQFSDGPHENFPAQGLVEPQAERAYPLGMGVIMASVRAVWIGDGAGETGSNSHAASTAPWLAAISGAQGLTSANRSRSRATAKGAAISLLLRTMRSASAT